MRNHPILRLAVLPVGLALAALAFAGPSSPSTTVSSTDRSPMPPTQQISDATLIKFGNAALAVRHVHREYQPKIDAASGSGKDQLEQEEKQAAGKAITAYMPVSQFMQIKTQVLHDPTLRARLKKLVKEHRENTAPPSSGSAPAAVSDATLIKFGNAVLAVRHVHREYQPKINAASGSDKDQLKQEEKQAAGKAITAHMPVSQFMQIKKQVRHDPAMRDRIKKLVKEHRENTAPPPSASAPAPVSDATLAHFLRASAALDKVRAQYETKIKAAPDDQTKLALRKEEKQAAGAAITPYMPVSEYKQVFSQVRHDPQLKARAEAMLKEAKKNHNTTTPASASSG